MFYSESKGDGFNKIIQVTPYDEKDGLRRSYAQFSLGAETDDESCTY